MSHRNNVDSRIYVGNLPPDVREKDVDDLFYKYGKITYIDLKNRRGPPFAFIEYDDARSVVFLSPAFPVMFDLITDVFVYHFHQQRCRRCSPRSRRL
jgi:hypothetical protein